MIIHGHLWAFVFLCNYSCHSIFDFLRIRAIFAELITMPLDMLISIDNLSIKTTDYSDSSEYHVKIIVCVNWASKIR